MFASWVAEVYIFEDNGAAQRLGWVIALGYIEFCFSVQSREY